MEPQVNTAEGQQVEAGESARGGAIFRPRTDIVDAEGGVTLMMEMPGVAVDDVDIELENRVLTVHGRAHRSNPENFRLAYAEYGEGDYERAFTVSEEFDPAKIKAELRNGVLWLTLPRAEAAKPRKIAVKAG